MPLRPDKLVRAIRKAPAARVLLSKPSLARAREFFAAVERSSELHGPWVSPPGDRAQFEHYLRGLRSASRVGYFVCRADNGKLAGVINISEIVRGCFLSGYLGYYAFSPHDGEGLMREGLSLVLDDAFGRQALHRLEANIQPENRRSIELVDGLGFRKEGESKDYLMINGRWQDHHRYALLADEWQSTRT